MRDIHLYINNNEVDLADESLVLYNWAETELSNPVNTQNSYSKVITLKGTKRNNRVFSHLWNLERVQTYPNELNPSMRIPFRITSGGDNIFEEGYCKLQSIKLVNGIYQYEITLFGMIGNFLYNLETNYGEGNPKTLADLHYYTTDEEEFKSELDLDFVINAAAVEEAWDPGTMGNDESKWSVINFADTYVGVPSTLDADKVMIDGASDYTPFITTSKTESGVTYAAPGDAVVVDTGVKLSKDEIKDYRSYLLTPIINVKKIIKAICDPSNNSGQYDNGYEVELDREFFNPNNPYYNNAWMTLPQITTLKNTGESKVGEGGISVGNMSFLRKIQNGKNTRFLYNIELPEMLKSWGTFEITLKLGTIFGTYGQYNGKTFYLRDHLLERSAKSVNAYGIQAYAISNEATSEYENILGGGSLLWLSSDGLAHYDPSWYDPITKLTYERAREEGWNPIVEPTSVASIDTVKWSRVYDSTFHMLNNKEGDRFNQDYKISISAPAGTRNIRIALDMVASSLSTNLPADNAFYGDDQTTTGPFSAMPINSISYYDAQSQYEEESSLFSNKYISKRNLLTTKYCVKDWLLSYCKLFGLYIWYDKVTNKIHIDSRKTFYKRNKITDISNQIDLSSDYTIKPVLAENRFYNMTQPQVQSDLAESYTMEYGKVYGMKTIDTGVDLDVTQKELMKLDFRSGIMANRKSLYNFKPTTVESTSGIPAYLCNGFTYSLYKDGIADDDAETKQMEKNQFNINGIYSGSQLDSASTYSDLFDKVLFANEDKEIDGSNVLLFNTGWAEDLTDNYGYYLSDDTDTMIQLNGKPTWLLTKDFTGKAYAKKITMMPLFSRYLDVNGHMMYSLDFGTPRKLYINNLISHNEATLYDNFYKTYYEDLYDVNTKQLTCYYKPKNVMSIENLREFYWYDNCFWRLNKVIDYNPENKKFVLCEFIKVQDIDNITSENASVVPKITVVMDVTEFPASGGTFTGYVSSTDYGSWTAYVEPIAGINPSSGSTNGEFKVDIPANPSQSAITYNITVEGGDVAGRATVEQAAGYGEFSTVNLTVTNNKTQTIRLGASMSTQVYTYRTIRPGRSEVFQLPVPFNEKMYNYDLVLVDELGNCETGKFTLTLAGGDVIIDYDLGDLNTQTEHITGTQVDGATLLIETE